MTDRTRVLVIGGWGRCGSTVLDMMLGQIDGFVSTGELRELWLRGCVEDRPCGCGEPFSRCPFWARVGKEAYGGWDQLDLETLLRARYRWDRPWGLPRLLGTPRPATRGDLATYVGAMGRLVSALAQVAQARVVIDSSKLPTHTLLLAQSADVDVRVVHLVRDSRGVAFSNRKAVVKSVSTGEPTLLPRYGAAGSALRYDFYNATNEVLARRLGDAWMRLRYEDVVADPRRALGAVAAHARPEEPHELPFLDGQRAELGENHLVDGNPVRFTRNALTLRVDDAWQRNLGAGDRRTVTALTWPLLRRYGYLRGDATPARPPLVRHHGAP